MKHQIVFLLTSLAVLISFATPSRADEDGLFCTSKGYVAYEVRQGITPGVIGHVLKVVRFGANRGIYVAGEVRLVDFEVYHLICSENQIEISGWNNVFTKYVIEISDSGELKALGPTTYPGRQWQDAAKDGPIPVSLGMYGADYPPVQLESFDAIHEYQLRRQHFTTDLRVMNRVQSWELHVKSELVQIDLKGKVLQHFVLYENSMPQGGE